MFHNVQGLPSRDESRHEILSETGIKILQNIIDNNIIFNKNKTENIISNYRNGHSIMIFDNTKGECNLTLMTNVTTKRLLEFMEISEFKQRLDWNYHLPYSDEENESILLNYDKNKDYVTLILYNWGKIECDRYFTRQVFLVRFNKNQ